jgi:hypothetical protein
MSGIFAYPSREKCLPSPAAPAPASAAADATVTELGANTTGALLVDGDSTDVRYYAIGFVSHRGIDSAGMRGLEKACEVYSLLLRDPKYNEFHKITRPARFRRTANGVDWNDSVDLDAEETRKLAAIEEICSGAAAAEAADFDAHRTRLCFHI